MVQHSVAWMVLDNTCEWQGPSVSACSVLHVLCVASSMLAWHGMAWPELAWHAPWEGMAWHELARHGQGMAWAALARRGMAWHIMA